MGTDAAPRCACRSCRCPTDAPCAARIRAARRRRALETPAGLTTDPHAVCVQLPLPCLCWPCIARPPDSQRCKALPNSAPSTRSLSTAVSVAVGLTGCSTVDNFLQGDKVDYKSQSVKTAPLEDAARSDTDCNATAAMRRPAAASVPAPTRAGGATTLNPAAASQRDCRRRPPPRSARCGSCAKATNAGSSCRCRPNNSGRNCASSGPSAASRSVARERAGRRDGNRLGRKPRQDPAGHRPPHRRARVRRRCTTPANATASAPASSATATAARSTSATAAWSRVSLGRSQPRRAPRPGGRGRADPGLEAEFLTRLMVKLGSKETGGARDVLAQAASAPSSAAPARARAVSGPAGAAGR